MGGDSWPFLPSPPWQSQMGRSPGSPPPGSTWVLVDVCLGRCLQPATRRGRCSGLGRSSGPRTSCRSSGGFYFLVVPLHFSSSVPTWQLSLRPRVTWYWGKPLRAVSMVDRHQEHRTLAETIRCGLLSWRPQWTPGPCLVLPCPPTWLLPGLPRATWSPVHTAPGCGGWGVCIGSGSLWGAEDVSSLPSRNSEQGWPPVTLPVPHLVPGVLRLPLPLLTQDAAEPLRRLYWEWAGGPWPHQGSRVTRTLSAFS